MTKELSRLGRLLSGNVLSIGFPSHSEFLTKLYENKKITQVYTLINSKNEKRGGKKKLFSGKTINIRKIKKVFKKKKIDYMFISLNSVDKFLHTVVKNSIDITDKNIYILLDSNKVDIEILTKKYTRYGCTCTVNKNLLNINCNKIKTKKIKNLIYFIQDINYEVQELIAFVLIGS